jgi:hypothetical protein
MSSDNYLATLQSDWLAANLGLRSYCGYETLPTYGITIVDIASATHLCTEPLDPIDANHTDIVKPSSTTSTSYRALKSATQETTPISRISNRRPPAPDKSGNNTTTHASCQLAANATSELVSRIYARGLVPPPGGNASYEPSLQELFYEWTITVMVNRDTQNLALEIHEEKPAEDASLKAEPESASILGLKETWMSGFEEKNRPLTIT